MYVDTGTGDTGLSCDTVQTCHLTCLAVLVFHQFDGVIDGER